MDKILVLDFGGQTCQLISRRVREIGVYSEILPGDTELESIDREGLKGIILSGSPYSVYDENAPLVDPAVYEMGVPVLGICYGLQRMTQDQGGRVHRSETREFGRSSIHYRKDSPLFSEIPEGFSSWMSHGDAIESLAPGFELLAVSENGLPALISHSSKPLFGIQFHPEVSHCEYGNEFLANFVLRICGASASWSMEAFLEIEKKALQERVGTEPVLLLISGGVDSTVVAALLLASLPAEQVHLMYVDTGLMRKNETAEITENLNKLGAEHIHIIHAAEDYYKALSGVSDPETKRQIIGDLFISIQQREVKKLNIPHAFLAQGTLYPDLIESGAGVGNKAKVIKSHHNVGTPLIREKRAEGRLIEPLSVLYKDEVRALGRTLNVPEAVVKRHPFPGPGLAIRIPGDVTEEKVRILQEADDIYIRELKQRGLYDEIWQAFAVLLPVRSVGVTGDDRHYAYVLALRAAVSQDAMTADVYPFPMKDLLEISSKITNHIREIGRVVYDISSKPPATIEWE